jgi:hypothetical protein
MTKNDDDTPTNDDGSMNYDDDQQLRDELGLDNQEDDELM